MEEGDEPTGSRGSKSDEQRRELDSLIDDFEINALRYFENFTLQMFERLTIREYQTLLKVAKLKRLDKEYFINLQAFKNQQVQSTDKKGKLVYKKMDDLFPYKKLENEILGIKPKKQNNKKIVELLMKANS